jgi:hypothetical protein
LLVCWPVTGVPSAATYPDMRRRMGLGAEPKSSAILWNYFFPRPLISDWRSMLFNVPIGIFFFVVKFFAGLDLDQNSSFLE